MWMNVFLGHTTVFQTISVATQLVHLPAAVLQDIHKVTWDVLVRLIVHSIIVYLSEPLKIKYEVVLSISVLYNTKQLPQLKKLTAIVVWSVGRALCCCCFFFFLCCVHTRVTHV